MKQSSTPITQRGSVHTVKNWLLATLLLAGVSVLGAPGCAQKEEALEHCSLNTRNTCRGDVVFECKIYQGVPQVEDYYWYSGEDCKAQGLECVSGQCVFPDLRCPEGQARVCRDGWALACLGDRVQASGAHCELYSDQHPKCLVVDGGAVCAIERRRCPHFAGLCADNVAYECYEDYPLEKHVCEGATPVCAADLSGGGAYCLPGSAAPPNAAVGAASIVHTGGAASGP